MIRDDFENSSPAKSSERLRVWMTVTDLGEVECEAGRILDFLGKLPEVVARRTDKEQRLHYSSSIPVLA